MTSRKLHVRKIPKRISIFVNCKSFIKSFLTQIYKCFDGFFTAPAARYKNESAKMAALELVDDGDSGR